VFGIPSIRIGKLFGIPLEIDLSWLVVFALVAYTLAFGYFPGVPAAEGAPVWLLLVLGAATSLLFFGSIVAHELTHSLVTRAEGGRVDKITLFIFGGVAQITEEPRSPGREFLMAAAGPAMSLLLAVVCYLGFVLLQSRGTPWWVWAPLQYLAAINLFVGVFNLLPGFPLDGGRVLRSILWAITGDVGKATRWASRSGQVIGWGMVAIALFSLFGGSTGLLWFGLVGWFIAWLAGSAYRQQMLQSRVAGVSIGDIMTHAPEYVMGDSTIEQFVHEHLLGRRHSRYPVMLDGMIVGLVSLPDIKAVAREEWPARRLIEVTNRDLSAISAPAETPVELVLPRLAGDAPGALLVVREGRLAGILTRADVLDFLNRPAA
jgi:Zn-dependent protease/predicted transcriptional regulator